MLRCSKLALKINPLWPYRPACGGRIVTAWQLGHANTRQKPMAKTNTAPAPAAPKAVQVAGFKLTGTQPTPQPRTGSARAAWWAALQTQLASGPVAASVLYAALQAAPPSTPKVGKLAGQCEPPAGWLGHFGRQGCIAAVSVKLTPTA